MCDTMVALGNVTKKGKVIFAKNSDRDPEEPAEIIHNPRKKYPKGTELKTTYISIPQVAETAEVILCKPIWIWGAEMGANEFGVTIGNEAVYTKEKYEKKGGLIGMDLLRLALERSKTAQEAIEVIIDLLELYGQGGDCGYRRKDLYHNSFIIADPNEAWVLETAGKYWIGEKIKDFRSISNTISIRGKGDIAHPELIENAIEKGWCKNSEEFDFFENYCKKMKIEQLVLRGSRRNARSTKLIKENLGNITEKTMMDILRYHEPKNKGDYPPNNANFCSICIHAKNILNPSQSTISLVSVLDKDIQTHWITGTSAPCTSIFKPVFLPGGMPKIGSKATKFYDKDNIWWRHEMLHRLVISDYSNRIAIYKDERETLEEKALIETEEFLNRISRDNNGEIGLLLKEFTMKKFSETRLKEEQWITKLEDIPIINRTPFAYRFYWQKRNRRNKMPKIKM